MARDDCATSALHHSYWHCRLRADAQGVGLLRQWGADGRISADHLVARDGMVHLVLDEADLAFLHGMGLAVERGAELRPPPLGPVAAPRAAPAPGVEADHLLTGWVSGYLGAPDLLARFAALHAAFPTITQWVSLPHATQGYDGSVAALHGAAQVKMLRINTTPASLAKPGLLLLAGQHAREWVPPIALLEFAEQLLRTYTPGSAVPEVQSINALVEGLDIFLIPASNPDGINYSHNDVAMWRKNRRPPPAASTCPGVDVNRNYGVYFGDAGSSGDACSEAYRGGAAFSEPESRNLLHVLEQYPNILTAVDCHSFGEELFRAQPSGGLYIASEPVEPADHAVFLGLEAAMNAAIGSVSAGKHYGTGTTNNHAGTCDDYLFLAHRVFGFTMECGLDFQPAVPAALAVVQEVAAALRALAAQTVVLQAKFTQPVAIAQAIDRSGSMVVSGYVATCRQNARRLVDLLSLGDAVSVSSFNQAAATHVALTTLDNPGSAAGVRAAIDAIDFGGSTSIGVGLQAARATLAGSTGRRAVVLLSDGYQNRAPWVADALAGWPAATPVYSIALGPASDQPLLQSIAAATGGSYAYSPDALGLYEIYSYVQAQAADEALVFNETLTLPARAGERVLEVLVDSGAHEASFALAWNDPQVELHARLVPPAGPVTDLSRMRRIDGGGYRLLRLRRPQSGVWRLVLSRKAGGAAVQANACAFLKSDLRLLLMAGQRLAAAGRPISVVASLRQGNQPLVPVRLDGSVAAPMASPAGLLQGWRGPMPPIPAAWLRSKDPVPRPVLQALALRDRIVRDGGADPLRQMMFSLKSGAIADLPPEDHGVLWSGTYPAQPQRPSARVLGHTDTKIPGSYNLTVRAQGRELRHGTPFVRLGLCSVVVTQD